jgi:predicted NUDIX family NTP pyrophosphohydrolase
VAARRSAGILLFRRTGGALEVLLVHPGGPFWARRDEGAWSIPKGEYEEGEEPRAAALREFEEELGRPVPVPDRDPAEPEPELIELGSLKQPADHVVSNTFELEWPPRSGKLRKFPEVDRAGWFPLPEARAKILRGQLGFIDILAQLDPP